MIKIRSSVTIHRPVADVYSYVAEPEKHPHWQAGLVEVSHTADRKLTEVRKVMGRRIEHTLDLVEEVENTRIHHRGGGAGHTLERKWHFEDIDGKSTLVSLEVDNDTGGILGLGKPAFERMMKREIDNNLHNLKDLLEAHEHLHSAAAKLPAHR
jgi:uncharacterized membrane protein